MIDNLISLLGCGFDQIVDHRRSNQSYDLSSYLKLSLAMFHLKDPSLSAFRNSFDVRTDNLKRVYGVEVLPGDTAIREAIDEVKPSELQALFTPQLDFLKTQGVLEQRYVLKEASDNISTSSMNELKKGYITVSIDGTSHYCSNKKGCPQCMVRKHRNGNISYYHQLLGAVAIHPDDTTVFPVACEAIVKQDGSKKNDCELNAAKRIIPQIRTALGENEQIIGVFDALYLNGPHIKALRAANMNYIIGTKGATYVDVQVEHLRKKGKLQSFKWETKNTICTVNYANGLILNGKHQDILTNYFELIEVDKQTGEQVFYSTWATDITITQNIIKELTQIARARWKIENETFNTLKNQGYHFGRNYGHGKKYLATNFAILTFLAFLIDQIAQHLDTDFQQAKEVCKTFKNFWEKIRSIFYLIPTMSMNAIYRFLIKKKQVDIPALE